MIQLQHISKTFHPGEAMQIKALQDVSLTIGSGEYVVVIGAEINAAEHNSRQLCT